MDSRSKVVLAGADLVLPDRILAGGTLVIEAGRIADIRSSRAGEPEGDEPSFARHPHYLVPGFVDVHVHGAAGVDVLGAANAVEVLAERLPRYGVTAFCPTTVACSPDALRRMLEQVSGLRARTPGRGARVLPAHLESNFISADYRGAQPASCLRIPREALEPYSTKDAVGPRLPDRQDALGDDFDAADILREIERAAPDVGLVTVAPELDGGLELVRWLTSRGHRVSLGHSGASYEQAQEAIALGAHHATHLFNRMPPFSHRSPGLVGAILEADEVAAELICDGFHVHPAVVRATVAAKRPSRVLAITDGTAASGLGRGARSQLGGQSITAGDSAAHLDDGTLAGSVATMDQVFRILVGPVGLPLVDAVTLCSTTASRELGLADHGVLAVGAAADIVVLDAQFTVVQTYIAGQLVYARDEPS